jgi:hypothetical protein
MCCSSTCSLLPLQTQTCRSPLDALWFHLFLGPLCHRYHDLPVLVLDTAPHGSLKGLVDGRAAVKQPRDSVQCAIYHVVEVEQAGGVEVAAGRLFVDVENSAEVPFSSGRCYEGETTSEVTLVGSEHLGRSLLDMNSLVVLVEEGLVGSHSHMEILEEPCFDRRRRQILKSSKKRLRCHEERKNATTLCSRWISSHTRKPVPANG